MSVTAFHARMRIEAGRNNGKVVRESIDSLFAAPPADLSLYAKEAILDLRLDSAANLEDAVRFVPRSTCAVSHQEELPNCAKTLTDHGARFLNGLPLDTLNTLLERKAFPFEVSDAFARNAFMRAVILRRHDVAQPLSRWIFSKLDYQVPVPQEQFRKLLADYQAAASPDEKQFAAIFLLQHLYAFGHEMNTNQPWCAAPAEFHDEQVCWRMPTGPGAAAPAFLSEPDRK